MAPLKSKTGGGTHTHNLRKGAGGANHIHNLRKIAGRGTNTQKLLKPYVTQRKRPKAEAAKKVINFLELPREIRDMILRCALMASSYPIGKRTIIISWIMAVHLLVSRFSV